MLSIISRVCLLLPKVKKRGPFSPLCCSNDWFKHFFGGNWRRGNWKRCERSFLVCLSFSFSEAIFHSVFVVKERNFPFQTERYILENEHVSERSITFSLAFFWQTGFVRTFMGKHIQ
jgi:hypothetical protein